MCSYTISLDDQLVNTLSTHFTSNETMREWMQREMEAAIRHYNEAAGQKAKKLGEYQAAKKLHKLATGEAKGGLKDLRGIMSMSKATAEELYDEYITEKYGI